MKTFLFEIKWCPPQINCGLVIVSLTYSLTGVSQTPERCAQNLQKKDNSATLSQREAASTSSNRNAIPVTCEQTHYALSQTMRATQRHRRHCASDVTVTWHLHAPPASRVCISFFIMQYSAMESRIANNHAPHRARAHTHTHTHTHGRGLGHGRGWVHPWVGLGW